MDEKLIKKAIKGNFKAYSLLVHSLKNEGYKLAYTILKNEQDRKLDLERSLAKIEPQVREMIRLKFYMGYKLDEIANILDVPVGTVKGKMYTALRSMKKDLEVR